MMHVSVALLCGHHRHVGQRVCVGQSGITFSRVAGQSDSQGSFVEWAMGDAHRTGRRYFYT